MKAIFSQWLQFFYLMRIVISFPSINPELQRKRSTLEHKVKYSFKHLLYSHLAHSYIVK